jgi:CheY-like chemotaxis protein
VAVRELEVAFSLTRAALTDTAAHTGAGGGLRALLVDHEPIALAVLRAAVQRFGHDCTAVTDGDAAVAEYERTRPQVVITELQAPGIDGAGLARRIRAAGDRGTFVAVLDASGGRGAAGPGDAVDARLRKPVVEEELEAVLRLAAQRAS